MGYNIRGTVLELPCAYYKIAAYYKIIEDWSFFADNKNMKKGKKNKNISSVWTYTYTCEI